MRKVAGILAFVVVLAFVGCEKSTKNEVSSSSPPKGGTPGKPSGGAAGVINPDNTSISFVGTKKEGKHDGGFKAFTGSVKPPSGDITAATISVEIETDSMFTDQEKLTAHLKSPDFFEVKKYPKASFTTTAIKAEKKDDNTHVVTGELTLHGTKKEISFPAKVTATDDLLTLESTFTIDRLDFGIAYAPDKVDKTVTIKVALKAARK
jgi:polyisoprenoid-binding protein YceI